MQLKRRYHFTWRNKRAERRKFWLFLLPSFLGVMSFVLLPFLDVGKRSLETAVTGKFLGLKNYQMIFSNEAFWLAVQNTIRFTLVCIPLLVIAGLFLALALSKIGNFAFFKSVYLLPLAIPTASLVLVWKMFFYERDSFWVLVVSYIWKNIGYTVVLWLAGILCIPRELIEAAKVDGASEILCFLKVKLPNLKGSLYTIVILSFLNSFKIFREAYLVAGAYPPQDMYLLQHLFNNWFVNMDFDKMAAATVCISGFLFVIIMLLKRIWDRDNE